MWHRTIGKLVGIQGLHQISMCQALPREALFVNTAFNLPTQMPEVRPFLFQLSFNPSSVVRYPIKKAVRDTSPRCAVSLLVAGNPV